MKSGGAFTTVTSQVRVLPSTDAVIVAVPGATASTTPLVTVATAGALLVQVTEMDLFGVTVTDKVSLSPTSNSTEDLLIA